LTLYSYNNPCKDSHFKCFTWHAKDKLTCTKQMNCNYQSYLLVILYINLSFLLGDNAWTIIIWSNWPSSHQNMIWPWTKSLIYMHTCTIRYNVWKHNKLTIYCNWGISQGEFVKVSHIYTTCLNYLKKNCH